MTKSVFLAILASLTLGLFIALMLAFPTMWLWNSTMIYKARLAELERVAEVLALRLQINKNRQADANERGEDYIGALFDPDDAKALQGWLYWKSRNG